MKDSRKDNSNIPTAALVLGALGLVPFVGCAMQIATGWPLAARMTGPALYALQIYGAIIVSFLGGIHWGLAVAAQISGADAWRRYGAAVAPALLAWLAVFQLNGGSSLYALAVVLVAFYGYERLVAGRDGMPVWMMQLRAALTGVATVALLAAGTFGPF